MVAVTFYTNLEYSGDYDTFATFETLDEAIIAADNWIKAANHHSATINGYGTDVAVASDWRVWIDAQLELMDYLSDTDPEPLDPTRATIKAAYSHVIDTVRAELGDKSQKYLNASAHATGNLETGLYVSVMHDTNANTLTISARAGGTIGRMATIATYDDQGRQSGFADVSRWPGADELLNRIYAIVSARLNPEPTPPTPPAPKKNQTMAQAFTPSAGSTKRELNADAYKVAGLLSDTPRSVLRVRPGSRKNGTSARYEVEINGHNVTHGYVSASDARAAIIRHYHENITTPEPTDPEPKKSRKTNTATSQARDNQRAERDQQREQYHNAATEGAATVTAVIADMGFTVAEEREAGDTPVTIWHDADGLATIKQTPYTIRIYNGRPKRCGKTAAVSFTLTVAYGWQQSGTGDGASHAFASLIAANIQYDDNGYGYFETGEQSPALDPVATEEESATVAQLLTVDASGNRNPVEFDRSGPWEAAYQYPAISGGSHDHTETCWLCETEPATHAHTFPNGSTDPMCDACQAKYDALPRFDHDRFTMPTDQEYPPISGGSHDHTPEPLDARRIREYEGKYKQMVRDGHAEGTLDDADFTAAFAGCGRPLKSQYFNQLRRHIVALPLDWHTFLEGSKTYQHGEYGNVRISATFDHAAYTNARHDGKSMNEAIAAAYGEIVLVSDTRRYA